MLLEAVEREKALLRDEIDEEDLKPDGGLRRVKAGMLRGLKRAYDEIPRQTLARLTSASVAASEAVKDIGTPRPEDPYA